MAEVGYASLGIIPSFDGFERNLTRGATGPMTSAGKVGGTAFGDSAGKTAGSRFGGAFKTAAKASLIGLGALGVGAFKLAGDAVSAASDLEESTNKVRQVFGKGADDVFRFSERAADALGQTNQAARDAASTFGLFGNIAGLSDRKSAKFAKRMTTLASDLASFHNTEPDQAVEALGAALRGEAEPIRAFGVLLDEATLKAEALRIGLLEPVKDKAKIQGYQVDLLKAQKEYNEVVGEFGAKSLEALDAQADLGLVQDRLTKATEGTIPQLTQQQKVLAAQSSIFKQTEVAQGDFARTSDGLANQQRRLRARFEDAKAELGEGLLPIMTQAADFLLDKGIPAFERASDWFNDTGLPAIQDFGGGVKDAWGEVKKLTGFLSDLPDSGKLAALGAVFAGGMKIKGVGLGGNRGGSIAKPLYVWTVNGVPGPTGGPGGGLFGTFGKWATKVGKFAAKAFVPTEIVVTGTAALKEFFDFHRPDGVGGASILGKGEFNRWWDRQFYDDGPVQGGNAWDKVRSSALEAQTESEKATTTWKKFYREGIKPVEDSRPKVKIEAPGLAGLLKLTGQYTAILDGLDGRTVRTHIVNTTRNNVIDEYSRTGARTPGGGDTFVHNGNIVANEPRDYERWRRRRMRHSAGGGVYVP